MSILLSKKEISIIPFSYDEDKSNATLVKEATIHAMQFLTEPCGCTVGQVDEDGCPYEHPIEHRCECEKHMAEIHKELRI